MCCLLKLLALFVNFFVYSYSIGQAEVCAEGLTDNNGSNQSVCISMNRSLNSRLIEFSKGESEARRIKPEFQANAGRVILLIAVAQLSKARRNSPVETIQQHSV